MVLTKEKRGGGGGGGLVFAMLAVVRAGPTGTG